MRRLLAGALAVAVLTGACTHTGKRSATAQPPGPGSAIPIETTTTTGAAPPSMPASTTATTTAAVPTTTRIPPACRDGILRSSLETDRDEYAPDDPVKATTTVRNTGRSACRLHLARDEDGCRPWVLVHFGFDPDGDGNYGPTTWTFGPYLTCPGGDLTIAAGRTITRTTTFAFGQGRTGELPDGDWQVIADWMTITADGTQFPVRHVRCVPGTCKPLADYATPTTTATSTTTTATTTTTTTPPSTTTTAT